MLIIHLRRSKIVNVDMLKKSGFSRSVTKFEKPSMIVLKFEEKSLIRKTGRVQSN